MKPAQIDYVRETLDLVKSIETRFLELGARLYRIREEQLWVNEYDSFQEFLDTAHINPSMASILTKIHKVYIVDGGKEQATLAGIGYSNLYEAIPLIEKDGIDGAIVKADTLTRSEIIEEKREEKYGEHTHIAKPGELWGVCESCGKFIKIT